MRVLVVDDDSLNRQIIESLLERRGHEAVTAASGEEALQHAHSTRPDVLMTDVFMPGMDGFQLCMRWRRDPELADIPFVFYTAVFTSPADERFALRIGADALLRKPLDGDTLLDTLEAAAKGLFRKRREKLPVDDEFQSLREYTDRIVDRFERKVAELNEANEMLLEANEMQSALVECSPLGLTMMDGDCSLRLWSPSAERIFGWTANEVIGVFNPLIHRDEKTEKSLRGLLDGGGAIQDLELPRMRSDGTQIFISMSAAPIMDGAGRPSGILALFSDVSQRKNDELELEYAVSQMERAMDGSVQVIARIIEKRDPYTAGHEQRVADLAVAIGDRMGLSQAKLRELYTAGSVHDVGKISVPTEILTKPGTLTQPEWEIIKIHPLVGLEILQAVDLGWPLADIVVQHHERMDGSGYPEGLTGERILIEARILAVADVVEAMSSHRPYRPARGVEEALAEVRQNRGVLYDADVVDACVAVVEEGLVAL